MHIFLDAMDPDLIDTSEINAILDDVGDAIGNLSPVPFILAGVGVLIAAAAAIIVVTVLRAKKRAKKEDAENGEYESGDGE